MITKGLRVRLASQGITGAAFLEADYIDPEEFPPMEITWEPNTYYVPSVPSKITQLTESVETILEKLEEINIKGITDGLEETISSMNKILDEVKMSKLTSQAGQLIAELRETNKKVKPFITDASETMDSVSEELPEILAQLKRTLRRFNNFVSNEEENVAVSTENVRLITGNLRDLTESAKKSPSQFIFAGPPPRSNPGGKQ